MKDLLKTKTFWGAAVAIGYAVFGYFHGTLTASDAGEILVPAILALFLRDGIRKAVNCAQANGNGSIDSQ